MARFWWQRGYRDGSYEKLPCLMEPRPASSKRHPLLAVSDGGGTSGITELRRRKRKLHNFSQRGEGHHIRTTFLLILRSGKERQEMLQAPERRFPFSLGCSPR